MGILAAYLLQCCSQCRQTKTEPGDGKDNDCDGRVDEEIRNGKDDDDDGFIDEDIQTVANSQHNKLLIHHDTFLNIEIWSMTGL